MTGKCGEIKVNKCVGAYQCDREQKERFNVGELKPHGKDWMTLSKVQLVENSGYLLRRFTIV